MKARWPTPFMLKAWLGGIGFALGLAGMVLERRWLVWVALGVLGAAFLARFLDGPRSGPR